MKHNLLKTILLTVLCAAGFSFAVQAETKYNWNADCTVYYDNSATNWSAPQLRLGCGSGDGDWSVAYALEKVAGTANCWKFKMPAKFENYAAFHIANKTGGHNYNVYWEGNSGDAWTECIDWQKYAVSGDFILSTSESGKKYCSVDKTSGAGKFAISFNDSQIGGTITVVKCNDDAGTSTTALASGDKVLPTQFIKISATPATDYTLKSLKVNGSDFTSGNTFTVSGNVEIVATFSSNSGPDPEPPTSKWTLRGSMNSWSGIDPLVEKAGGEANTLYLTKHFDAGKEYEFKIVYEGTDWYGNTGTMTQYHHSDWVFSTSESSNCKLATNIAGNYEFAFNTSTKAVTVSYPDNPKQAKGYETPVPENNGDVMIQAFYWAHEGNTATPYKEFGSVDWKDLNNESGDLAKYFDLVWLAPTQETADYTGYLPMNYSHQGVAEDKSGHHGHSPWGTAQELRSLIDNLHKGGAKVIADIVLNHTSAGHVDEYKGSDKNWCTWTENDFGRYGKFTIDRTWITAEDELFATDHQDGRIDASVTGDCGNTSGLTLTPDDKDFPHGDNDEVKGGKWKYELYNSPYSRDLAHGKKEVREFSRAYLTWMRDSIGYDGWRYDFMKGIHGSRVFDYNRTTAPCFSVAELFDGDLRHQVGFVEDANRSSYTFDFPGKFSIYNEAIREYKLENLKGNNRTMIYDENNRKFAVTFIDNHDSFHENYNLYGSPNSMDDRQVHQALAYLFSMPGVPCVLYPYWNNYKDICMALITARKSAGVHSQSYVEDDWAACENASDRNNNTYYNARIKGENGYLFLKLGKKCDPLGNPGKDPAGKDYKLAWGNEEAAVYYTGEEWKPYVPSDVELINSENDANGEVKKFIQNGVMYIQRCGHIYDVTGRRVE